MIAEDSPVVRWTICALLEREGMSQVASAPDFFGAMQIVEKEGPFDLVLLDYNMPGMEGLSSLSRMIKANAPKPVGLISANIPFDEVTQAVALGACGFIPKILAPRLVVGAIAKMAQGQKFHPDHFLKQTA